MKVTIIANGNISNPKINSPLDGILIAADGGGSHCLKLGLNPQVVIGDFDSLSDDALADLESRGARLIRYPADKDETDLELALDYALGQGASEITLYGLLGGRWDMTISNLMLLASPRFTGIQFQVIDGDTEIFVLRGGETLELHGQSGDTVSVIPLSGNIQGLTYNGLRWPLENGDLPFGTPRGVSNRLLGEKAWANLDEGVALVVVIHP
jgi:thiamine pyrophosphokinase